MWRREDGEIGNSRSCLRELGGEKSIITKEGGGKSQGRKRVNREKNKVRERKNEKEASGWGRRERNGETERERESSKVERRRQAVNMLSFPVSLHNSDSRGESPSLRKNRHLPFPFMPKHEHASLFHGRRV